ncbi:MAG: hypothetical protein JW934_00700 [Anaerolineae bacterium]|nr:hypothetical protein [Anaerolineae bacterium]
MVKRNCPCFALCGIMPHYTVWEEIVRRSVYILLIAAIIALLIAPAVWANDGTSSTAGFEWWAVLLSWLVPVGLGLIACGAAPPERTAAVIRVGWLALAIAAIGYWLCGFAFQFGGVGFFLDHPDLSGLVREWVWSPADAANPMGSLGGGMLGLTGYMLRGPAATPTALMLFLAQLPWLTTAIAILLWSLQGRAGPVTLLAGGVLIALICVVFGNWTWGGGWLAALDVSAGLGHGWVDAWGIGPIFLVGGAGAFAGMLAFGIRRRARADYTPSPADEQDRSPVPMPPLYMPVLATLGAWLTLIGWIGWGLSTPLMIANPPQINVYETVISVLLATAGGALVSGTFSWLVTGRADALMVARGVVSALIAVGAGAPFMPAWAALAVGTGAGLLVPLVQYTVDHLLRLDDPTSAVATHGIPALWGLLAVGLFADGHAGQGWNRGETATGVSGLIGGAREQFQAQSIGVLAMALAAFFLLWLLFALGQTLTRAWQGEYTLRLPRQSKAPGEPSVLQRGWSRLRAWGQGLFKQNLFKQSLAKKKTSVEANVQADAEVDADTEVHADD